VHGASAGGQTQPVPFALMELELWQEAQVGFSRKWERVISSPSAKNSALTNRSRRLTLVAASYPLYLWRDGTLKLRLAVFLCASHDTDENFRYAASSIFMWSERTSAQIHETIQLISIPVTSINSMPPEFRGRSPRRPLMVFGHVLRHRGSK
jgi:hypothetical protein